MIKLLALALTIFISGFISSVAWQNVKANDVCPAGSYKIGIDDNGKLICKQEPTGCPYGDSIPIDSPKCAPPPIVEKVEKVEIEKIEPVIVKEETICK